MRFATFFLVMVEVLDSDDILHNPLNRAPSSITIIEANKSPFNEDEDDNDDDDDDVHSVDRRN